jgi:hypothetical protein
MGTVRVTQDEWVVAIHEAAHACVAVERRIAVQHVTVLPDGDSLGHVRHCSLATVDEADAMMLFLAGIAAEEKVTGRPHQFGVRDLDNARTLVGDEMWHIKRRGSLSLWSDAERLERYHAKAAELVSSLWSWIVRVARHLCIYKTLYQYQIVHLKFSDLSE